MDLPFPNPKQLENDDNTIQPPRPTIYVEVNNTSSQTELTYDMQKPKCNITSHKLTFIKQIITHPIDQFSKVALLIAHNSLPNVQPIRPDENVQKDFVLKIENYMNNMFHATHNMVVDYCKANSHTQATV